MRCKCVCPGQDKSGDIANKARALISVPLWTNWTVADPRIDCHLMGNAKFDKMTGHNTKDVRNRVDNFRENILPCFVFYDTTKY